MIIKRILLCIAIFLAQQSNSKTVINWADGELSTSNEAGYVVLKEGVAFAAQVSQPNTIYEIRYKYDLKGQSVIVPEGSVLYVNGGSVENGVLVGKHTTIKFTAGSLRCILNGNFDNENISIEWFGIKSGKENSASNDKIMSSFIIPSMESIGNTLYMNPQTEMYFSKPLTFNGTYDLDLRGRLRYSGELVSTAVSVGTPSTKTVGKTFNIHSVSSAKTALFYNGGKITENVGVCLWNLKQCNITLEEVLYFSYCVRLCGNIGGCSSNTIHFTRIGGNCYYGIHCFSYDQGWVNENTFYCKTIMNYSSNPAKDVMCAIWLDAEGKNSCNSNVFFTPCVENCYTVARLKNAMFNNIYDARAEHIGQALIYEGNSRDNSLYCKYWDRKGNYNSYGSNRVIKQNEQIPPFVQVFSEQTGSANSQFYGVCFSDKSLKLQGKIDGEYIIGRIVEVADPAQDVNVEFVFEKAGRFCIVPLNDDYTFKSPNTNDKYILNTNVNILQKSGILIGALDARRSSILVSKKCKKMLIGTYGSSETGDVLSMSVYSDNLIVDDLYKCKNNVFTLEKKVTVSAFYYESPSNNFLSSVSTIVINNCLNLMNRTLDLRDKIINIGKEGCFLNGTIDISGSSIYPNYNELVRNPNITVKGIPAAGTFFFQKGIPTWSNGTAWVDASGKVIK